MPMGEDGSGTVDGNPEILHHLRCKKPVINNRINYQPQRVQDLFCQQCDLVVDVFFDFPNRSVKSAKSEISKKNKTSLSPVSLISTLPSQKELQVNEPKCTLFFLKEVHVQTLKKDSQHDGCSQGRTFVPQPIALWYISLHLYYKNSPFMYWS